MEEFWGELRERFVSFYIGVGKVKDVVEEYQTSTQCNLIDERNHRQPVQ